MTIFEALFFLGAFFVMHQLFVKYCGSEGWSYRVNFLITLSGVCLISIGVWVSAIRDSQLAPHRITQSINGKIINDFWATNPVYITYSTELRAGLTNGYYCQVPHTNYYWHVWKCFQK